MRQVAGQSERAAPFARLETLIALADLRALIVLADLRALLGLPGDDGQSPARSATDVVLAEIDAFVAQVAGGRRPAGLVAWTLRAGELAQTRFDGDLMDAYQELTRRLAAALAKRDDCDCLRPPFLSTGFVSQVVGVDPSAGRFAEVGIASCRVCGTRYLDYRFELEATARSGRWYRAPLPWRQAAFRAEQAPEVLSLAPFHFRGGSYFDSAGELCQWPFDPRAV